MRATITSSTDTIVLGESWWDGSDGWFLNADDGLDADWFGSAGPKALPDTSVPNADGAFWPSSISLKHRVFPIRGFFLAASSTLQAHVARDRVNALAAQALEICIEDGAGPRWVTGYLTDTTGTVTRFTEDQIDFTLLVTCPDPLKYGEWVEFQVAGGAATVEMNGSSTAATQPLIITTGVTRNLLVVDYRGRTFEWAGMTNGLTVDMSEGIPLDGSGQQVGRLLDAGRIEVPPGRSVMTVQTDAPSATVQARPGWK